MNNIISIVGIEGSGKTYFISNIFSLDYYTKIYEPNFDINKILKTNSDILDNKEKQNLIHNCMLERDIKLADGKKYIIERDYISAVHTFKLTESRYYEYLIENFITNHKDALPNIVIFMDTSLETCLRRIHNRGRQYETTLTIEDLKIKRNLHLELLNIYKKLNINTFRYSGENEDYPELIKYIKGYDFSLSKYIMKKLFKPKVIVIEGNISSGKSTLLKYYKDNNYTVIDEPFEEMNKDYNVDFLQLYYRDQANKFKDIKDISPISLNFQTMIFLYKLKMFNDAYNRPHKDNIIFVERSILSGLDVFCKSNILTNSEKQMMHYLYNHKILGTKFLCYKAKEIIYINVKPDVCMNRTFEKYNNTSIDLDLLRSIDTNYYDMLKKIKKSGIKVFNVNNNNTFEIMLNMINSHLKINLNKSKK